MSTAPLLPHGIVAPQPHSTLPRFGLICVGDELLSGRRTDKHVAHTIDMLQKRGLQLAYVHMVGDGRADIAQQLRVAFASGDVVFSCGGIGATPDDQTRQAAAEALGEELVLHPVAAEFILQRSREMAEQKGLVFDPASPDHAQRLQMALFPRSAQIIPNPYNRIAGFSCGHVHFVPGFPAMAWPMLEWVLDQYYAQWAGQQRYAEASALVQDAVEAKLTPLMLDIEDRFPEVKVFSLPTLQHPEYGPHIDLGVKGSPAQVEQAFAYLLEGLQGYGCKVAKVLPLVMR